MKFPFLSAIGAGMLLCGFANPTVASAQTATPLTTADSTVMDTTIRPGHLDYSRYQTPSVCVQAALSAARVAERAQLDTAPYAPERDSLPPAAITVAQQCGDHFRVPDVAQRELLSLVQLSLMTGRDTVARAAANRWLSLLPDPEARGWAMYALVQSYVSARPSRFDDAKQLVAQMDSLGTSAIAPRINAHGVLVHDAEERFDVPSIEREAFAALRLYPMLVGETRNDVTFGGGSAVFSILWAELYRAPGTAVNRVMDMASQAGYRWPGDTTTVRQYMHTIVAPIGHAPPPLSAQHWYGPHGQDNWPVPGKVSLLMMASPDGSVFAYSRYALIRRLHERYGDSLNITLMTKTAGYIRDSPPLTPEQEADSLRQYFQGYLELPVTVGVAETPFRYLPDGRRANGPVAFETIGLYGYGPVLVDQQGNTLIIGVRSQAGLEAFIDKALHPEAK
jgi:hypothetical protein